MLPTEPIAATALPRGVTFGALVNGLPVYRVRNTWALGAGVCAGIWAQVQQDIPVIASGRIVHGSLLAAGFTGSFTQAQADEYHKRVRRITDAAQRARRVVKA